MIKYLLSLFFLFEFSLSIYAAYPYEKCHIFMFNSCALCISGYTLVDGKCEACSEGCKSCKAKQSCSDCLPGYIFFHGECKLCGINCRNCSTSNNCTECMNDFQLAAGRCDNCVAGKYHDTQLLFEPFTVKKICKDCPKTCSECLSTTNCLHCKTGLYGQVCQYNCNLCENKHCSKLGCTNRCKDGYFEDENGGCSQCTVCQGNSCMNITGKCMRGCKDRYYQDNDLCYVCQNNCKTCSSFEKCNSCEEGKWGLGCKLKCSTKCIGNVCDMTTGVCENECERGQYLGSDNMCYHCPDNCSTCNTNDSCSSCIDGHFGIVCEDFCSKKCKNCSFDSKSYCYECFEGYYLDSIELTCYPCHNSCSSCYGPNGNQCLSCYNKYFIKNNVCSNCNVGCLSCLSESICRSCVSGYFKSIDKCNRCPENCASCSSNKTCFKCDAGFFGATCLEHCHEYCQTCYNNVSCSTCLFGRYGDAEGIDNLMCACSATECSTLDQRTGNTCLSCFKSDWFTTESGCCPGLDTHKKPVINGLVFGGTVGGVSVCVAIIIIFTIVYLCVKTKRTRTDRNTENNEAIQGPTYENLVLNDTRGNTSSEVQQLTYESLQGRNNASNYYSEFQPEVLELHNITTVAT